MTTYTLEVGIQDAECKFLKENKFKLCLAKPISGKYTTIWHVEDFTQLNHFRWTEEYQALFVDQSKRRRTINARCFGTNMRSGQTAVIDPMGYMNDATGAPDSEKGNITIINHLGKATRISLRCVINDYWRTCYISPGLNAEGDEIRLQSSTKVMVWFEQDVQAGAVITQAPGTGFEVDFPNGETGRVAWFGAPGAKYKAKGHIGKGGNGLWSSFPRAEADLAIKP